MYRIWFYRTERGERPVEQYVSGQDPRHRRRVAARLELLAEEGPQLRRPYADAVAGPLRELRVGFGRLEHRIFYYFVRGDNVVLLHAFTKKTQQLPAREIETAQQRMEEVNRRLAAGEELA
ncbi:MAG: type II toxin-antitoxin system RelE/ParE family toxin [Planctomycetes bacterium]|nr:type II toxin-antitoxin system RelE/ParE family toxin [Planctomycetota bacterium]